MHETFINENFLSENLANFPLSSFYLQTLTVLNPFRATEKDALDDCDLAGPLVFCLAFGSFLLLVSVSSSSTRELEEREKIVKLRETFS